MILLKNNLQTIVNTYGKNIKKTMIVNYVNGSDSEKQDSVYFNGY